MNCTPCSYGEYSRNGSDCQFCSPGSVCEAGACAACQLCSPGSYVRLPGQRRCQKCDPGTYSGKNGTVSCTPCGRGQYNRNTGTHWAAVASCGFALRAELRHLRACRIDQPVRLFYMSERLLLPIPCHRGARPVPHHGILSNRICRSHRVPAPVARPERRGVHYDVVRMARAARVVVPLTVHIRMAGPGMRTGHGHHLGRGRCFRRRHRDCRVPDHPVAAPEEAAVLLRRGCSAPAEAARTGLRRCVIALTVMYIRPRPRTTIGAGRRVHSAWRTMCITSVATSSRRCHGSGRAAHVPRALGRAPLPDCASLRFRSSPSPSPSSDECVGM